MIRFPGEAVVVDPVIERASIETKLRRAARSRREGSSGQYQARRVHDQWLFPRARATRRYGLLVRARTTGMGVELAR